MGKWENLVVVIHAHTPNQHRSRGTGEGISHAASCAHTCACTGLYGQTTRTVHRLDSCLINRILCTVQ